MYMQRCVYVSLCKQVWVKEHVGEHECECVRSVCV